MHYRPLKQRPYLCVAVCLEMVLDRRDIPHKSQLEIGRSLGLVVPEGKAELFPNTQTSSIRPEAGWGTQVQKDEYSLNNYFEKQNINLKETYRPLDSIPKIKEFLVKSLKEFNDVLVCFDEAYLTNSKKDKKCGHVNVVEGIDEDSATLIDPDTFYPKRVVLLKKLVEAIEMHGVANRAGFWIISEK